MARPTDIGPSVAALIFDRQGRVLLSQRLRDRNVPGQWGAPGGWIERNDGTIKAAARREAFEEAGLVLDRVHIIGASLHDTSLDFGYVTVWTASFAKDWRGEPVDKEPEKHGPWVWCPLDDMPQPLVAGTWRMALKALEEGRR